MNKNEIIEFSKKIDFYLKGKLNHKEIDSLWLDFLKRPILFEYFETELHLRSLILNNRKEDIFIANAFSDHCSNIGRIRKLNFRKIASIVCAAAAVLLIIFGIHQFVYLQDDAPKKFALANISANEMVAANILRSEDYAIPLVEMEMNRAIAEAYNSEYQIAKERLLSLLLTRLDEPQKIMIEFNLGILSYNLMDFDSAKTHFLNVLGSDHFESRIYYEQAWWFLANNYLMMNRVADAKEAASNAAGIGGGYQEKANDFLQRLQKFE